MTTIASIVLVSSLVVFLFKFSVENFMCTHGLSVLCVAICFTDFVEYYLAVVNRICDDRKLPSKLLKVIISWKTF